MANSREVELNFSCLPQKFDAKATYQKRKKDPQFCDLCEAEFKKLRNPVRNCKQCAKSVCEVCSEIKRQLSKEDPEKYRVCDECDTRMDNCRIQNMVDEIVRMQESKIQEMMNQQSAHDLQLSNQKEQNRQELEDVDIQITEKMQRKEQLEAQVKDRMHKISDLNAARDRLINIQEERDEDIAELRRENLALEKKREQLEKEVYRREKELQARGV